MKKAPRPSGKRKTGRSARLGQGGRSAGLVLAFETLEDRRMLSADPLSRADVGWLKLGAAAPLTATSSPGGFTPTQLRQAYGIDQITFNSGAIQGNGSGQTIAIVTAYHNNKIANDLAAFDSYFNLAAPPSFVQVAQDGTTNYQGFDSTGSFELETALDVEWSHAIAPAAGILLPVKRGEPRLTACLLTASNGFCLASNCTYPRRLTCFTWLPWLQNLLCLSFGSRSYRCPPPPSRHDRSGWDR